MANDAGIPSGSPNMRVDYKVKGRGKNVVSDMPNAIKVESNEEVNYAEMTKKSKDAASGGGKGYVLDDRRDESA